MRACTKKQEKRAIAAAAARTVDPLKDWLETTTKEECPICFLPLPLDALDKSRWRCCGTNVCLGCAYRQHKRSVGKVQESCPFCRESIDEHGEKAFEREMKLANAGRADAMGEVGTFYWEGHCGLKQDRDEGLKWLIRAVEAGDGSAAMMLGLLFHGNPSGECWHGIEKDEERSIGYFRKAADLGNIDSYVLLGNCLMKRGEIEEALLNWRKAVMRGYKGDGRLTRFLLESYRRGFITKQELELTLREHKSACDELTSKAREEALRAVSS